MKSIAQKKKAVSFFQLFLEEESGQSTTEYILILSVVVMVALKFKSTFQAKLTGILDKVSGQIDNATNAQ